MLLPKPTLIPWVLYIVGVVTRAISVVADIAVLGFTLWKTIHVWRMDEEDPSAFRPRRLADWSLILFVATRDGPAATVLDSLRLLTDPCSLR